MKKNNQTESKNKPSFKHKTTELHNSIVSRIGINHRKLLTAACSSSTLFQNMLLLR